MPNPENTAYERITKLVKEELADCSCEEISAITILTGVRYARKLYPNSPSSAQDYVHGLVSQGFDGMKTVEDKIKVGTGAVN